MSREANCIDMDMFCVFLLSILKEFATRVLVFLFTSFSSSSPLSSSSWLSSSSESSSSSRVLRLLVGRFFTNDFFPFDFVFALLPFALFFSTLLLFFFFFGGKGELSSSSSSLSFSSSSLSLSSISSHFERLRWPFFRSTRPSRSYFNEYSYAYAGV